MHGMAPFGSVSLILATVFVCRGVPLSSAVFFCHSSKTLVSPPALLPLCRGAPAALAPVGSSREVSAGAGACSPGHLLQGQRFNAAPCFTITCQSTSCLGFLEEIFIPSRCSVGSTLHYPEPATDELLVEESVKPPVVSSPRSGGWSWALLLCHLVLSLYSVPGFSQICVFRPLRFCAVSASFLPLFLQFFTGVPISGPALESSSDISSQSPLAPSSYSTWIYLPKRATLLPKPKQPFSLTRAFWREPFPRPDGYLQNLLGFCHDLSLGKGVGFLEFILSRK